MSLFFPRIKNNIFYLDAGNGMYGGASEDDGEPGSPSGIDEDAQSVQASAKKPVLSSAAGGAGKVSRPDIAEIIRKRNRPGGSIKKALRAAATDTGINYARQRLEEKRQDPQFQNKYGGLLGNVAGEALQGAEAHRAQGRELKVKDAANIAKQSVVKAAKDTGKEKLKAGAAKGLAKVLAEHPELAGDAERLAQQFVKNKKIDLSGGAVDKLGQNLAKKGLENVAKGAAKEGTKQLANQAIPVVGAVSARDALTGINRGIKDASDGKVISAAKDVAVGVAKSTLVTGFRLSYQWEVVAASVGLSLIATFILGNLLLILSNRGISFLEKLAIIAIDVLLLFIVLGLLVVVVSVAVCGGGTGWAVWVASWVSTSAAQAQALCTALGK